MNTIQIDYEKEFKMIDLSMTPPAEEPKRQYYFMKKCRVLVSALSQKLGRTPTASAVTFGCPKNDV